MNLVVDDQRPEYSFDRHDGGALLMRKRRNFRLNRAPRLKPHNINDAGC
jgi:hypothetical protein